MHSSLAEASPAQRAILGAGVVLGVAIWIAAPLFTGAEEAFDAPGNYYPLSLFLSGFGLGLLLPRSWWLAAVALFLGQALYGFSQYFYGLATNSNDPSFFIPVGLIAMAFFSGIGLVGAGLAAALRQWLNRSRFKTTPPTDKSDQSDSTSL